MHEPWLAARSPTKSTGASEQTNKRHMLRPARRRNIDYERRLLARGRPKKKNEGNTKKKKRRRKMKMKMGSKKKKKRN